MSTGMGGGNGDRDEGGGVIELTRLALKHGVGKEQLGFNCPNES